MKADSCTGIAPLCRRRLPSLPLLPPARVGKQGKKLSFSHPWLLCSLSPFPSLFFPVLAPTHLSSLGEGRRHVRPSVRCLSYWKPICLLIRLRFLSPGSPFSRTSRVLSPLIGLGLVARSIERNYSPYVKFITVWAFWIMFRFRTCDWSWWYLFSCGDWIVSAYQAFTAPQHWNGSDGWSQHSSLPQVESISASFSVKVTTADKKRPTTTIGAFVGSKCAALPCPLSLSLWVVPAADG